MNERNVPRSNEDVLSERARELIERAEREAEREAEQDRQEGPASREPLFSGLFLFLLDFRALLRWGILTLFAVGLTTIFEQFLQYMAGGLINQVFAIALGMLMGPLTLLYLTVTAVCGLVILQDTANGWAKIQQWPGRNIADWMFDAFYVLNPLWLAALPGVLLGQLPVLMGIAGQGLAVLGGMLSAWVLFPLFSLCVVEAGSPLSMWSQAIFRQFRSHRAQVKSFYLVSAGLVLAGLLALYFLARSWFPVRVFGAAGLNLVVMVYFRLLGRLAGLMDDPSIPEVSPADATDSEQP